MAGALRSRGLLAYAQPDALRAATQAVADDPLSSRRTPGATASSDPNLAPPPVTPTSPLIALRRRQAGRDAIPSSPGGNIDDARRPRRVDNLHGTATAAVAAAPVNGVGILGVWPGARALNVPLPDRAITLLGLGRGHPHARSAAGAAVINMSYGSQQLCRAEYNAIQLAVRRGIVPVAAAGNEFDRGNPLEFPPRCRTC